MHLAVSLNIASAAGQTVLTFSEIARFVGEAEAAGIDMVVIADSSSSGEPSSSPFEATTLIAALATVTSRIGLVAAASTVAHQPYNLARRFASLDIISHGRAGWHATMAQAPREAANFSRPEGFSPEDFRLRAEEFIYIVQGLWNGWDADALLFDKAGGRFHDPEKMHLLNHSGAFFSVRGPLNVARSPQDRPVFVLSGMSEPDMDIAARAADVILVDEQSAEGARLRRQDLMRRIAACGRKPEAVKVLINVPCDVAVDRLELLLRSTDCDGFNMLVPAAALDDFVNRLLPAWRRCGLVHQDYHGATLRSHLGLAGGGDR